MAFWAMFIVMMGTIYYTLSRMSILKFKPVLLLISLSFILIIIWFRNGLILGGGEEGLIFYNLSTNLSLSASTWADINTGMPNLYWLPRLPFLYAASFFTNIISLPPHIVQAGLFLLLMLSGILAMYYLTLFFLQDLEQKKLIAFFSALFYLMNPFSMSQVWGRGLYPQFFSFALFPLSLLLFAKALRDKKYFYILPLIIISVLYSGAFGFITSPITYWVILTAYFLWWLVANKFKNLKFGFTLIFLTFASWLFIHAFWLLPFIMEGNKIFSGLVNLNDNLGSLIGVSGNFKPHILIRLLQRTYFFDASAYSTLYKSFIFQLISFIPLIFLSLGIILALKKEQFKKIRFFLALFIGGLIVSLGANAPFGPLFVWIFNHVTVLQAFRNPFEKFGLVYVMGYAPLFALGLWSVASKVKNANLYIIPVLFLIFGLFAWPMWTGRILAGIDKKIGLKVPSYYEDLNAWLQKDSENYRIFMTPLLSGEGAAFEWEESKYNGVDPMHFILDRPAISNSAQIPFYYDFAQNLRNYMGRINLAPSLGLLRAKYLAARGDAILISENEAKQEERLTKMIYLPTDDQDKAKTICANMISQRNFNSPAWITCLLLPQDGNWEKIKYLNASVYTDVPAEIEIAVRDINGNRPRWYGRNDSAYKTTGKDFAVINIPLDLPTEFSTSMDYSRVAAVEVLVRTLEQGPLVNEIRLKEIKLDEGREEPINNFRLVNQFGKINLYEPSNSFNAAPEFGLVSSILAVSDFGKLFQAVEDQSNQILYTGFVLSSQNPSKNLEILARPSNNKILNQAKISKTRYWLSLENREPSYIILSQTFNPEWKIIENIEQDEVKEGLINGIKLLGKIPQNEDAHFVVNGYANLWVTDSSKAAIIFLPQIYADIGAKISIYSLSAIFTATLIILIKKKFKH